MKIPHLAAAAALAASLLAAPAFANSTAGWTSADFQRAVLLQCKDELGIRGDARLATTRASNGAILVRARSYDRTTPEMAAEINACADLKTRSGGYAHVNAYGYPLWPSARQCERLSPVMYRGNLYCFKGR